MGKSFPAKMDRRLLGGKASDDRNMAGDTNLLRDGDVTGCEPLPWGSNAVFVLSLARGGRNTKAIYKPQRGEAPLWDFPDGTLYRRELASYVVSQTLGWGLVPPTVIRPGPYGIGAVQLFINTVPVNYENLAARYPGALRRIAAFDWLVNNADRKAGHCLQGEDGWIWAVDHGLTFHTVPKLRTVIWDFSGQPVPQNLVDDLGILRKRLRNGDGLARNLSQLISADEIDALEQRLGAILEHPVFPAWTGSYRSVPWPPF